MSVQSMVSSHEALRLQLGRWDVCRRSLSGNLHEAEWFLVAQECIHVWKALEWSLQRPKFFSKQRNP